MLPAFFAGATRGRDAARNPVLHLMERLVDERLKEGAALGGDTCHAAQGGVAGNGLVQRAQLALERERVEHMGAFGRVHQQQRHAALLLLGIKILRQAVKQPERQVARGGRP